MTQPPAEDETAIVEYVRWAYVKLKQKNRIVATTGTNKEVQVRWVAKLKGHLLSTSKSPSRTVGPLVEISRSAKTADGARDSLKLAVEAQGWEIR